MYVCTYVCMHACMYVCVCLYMYIRSRYVHPWGFDRFGSESRGSKVISPVSLVKWCRTMGTSCRDPNLENYRTTQQHMQYRAPKQLLNLFLRAP